MLDCISVENMRLSDQQTIAELTPGLTLMGRAAEGVFRAVQWHGRVAIVAGSGNNGGDGFALAVLLNRAGVECAVYTLSQKLSADSAHYAALVKEAGVPVVPFTSDCLAGADMVVDCLLGTGFQGGVRPQYREAIEAINASGAYVVSVDINSGMNGDTGEAEIAVRSDLTVTIGYVKQGLVTENAGRFMKRLVCADIGIRLAREEKKLCDALEWEAHCGQSDGFLPCPPWVDMKTIQIY